MKNCWIFKISPGFSLKLKPHDSLNLASGRACLFDNFQAYQLYFKKPSGNQNIDLLVHLQNTILSDAHYVFIGLARGLSVLNLAYSKRFVFLFDFWLKMEARINIISLEVVFGVLVPAGSEIEFRLRGDLGVAQSDFLQKCRTPTNIHDNCLTCQFLDFL